MRLTNDRGFGGHAPDRRALRRIGGPLLAGPLLVSAALSLAGCGSDRPPPLTGNLTDARGAHAGSFRPVDPATGNTAAPPRLPNTQEPLH